jgi:hypothetical protein
MKKISLVICGMLLVAATVHAADSFHGNWTLNLAKSEYDPGPAPKSQTTILEPVANGATRENDENRCCEGRQIADYEVSFTNGKGVKVHNVMFFDKR